MGGAGTVTTTIAALTAFLILSVIFKYAIDDAFTRTRLLMTAFFVFIVFTLTLAFYPYTLASLPYTIPAAIAGIIVGYVVGVRAAQEKLMMEGLEHYIEDFAHVHLSDVAAMRWWSIINFYSVTGALLLINFVGLSAVIFAGHESWAILACVFGAFLLGTLVPYLAHLWGIRRMAGPQAQRTP